jgi:hypothetical protein
MAEGLFTHCGYGAGHPWFYFLGGPVLTPKEIREEVRRSGYRGYLADDICKADRKPEPQRSKALRELRAEMRRMLRADISRYREVARALHAYRRQQAHVTERPVSSADIHMSMSLKHNHIYNQFAHLLTLDELLGRQRDLFDF